jgi:Na+(H+)/acetate symporter ActP
LPWRGIGMVICFLGLLVTAAIGWTKATTSSHDYYAATTGGGLGLIASAIALASGLAFLRRP